MNLPGLITATPDRPDELETLACMVGECFLEEMWYATWLEGLDTMGATRERKLEIMQATIRSDFKVSAPYGCVLSLPDGAGAANVYLRSELGDTTWTELESQSEELMAPELSEAEVSVLGPRAEAMEHISITDWPYELAAPDEDFLYFISIGVDASKRGSGAFRRLITPFLDYADAHGLKCYLDCYTERLEQLYAHFGFEVEERRRTEGFSIEERLMVRNPR